MFKAKDTVLPKYLAKVRELLKLFAYKEVKHVLQSENTVANILSKLVSTLKPGNIWSVIQETLSKSSISIETSPRGTV